MKIGILTFQYAINYGAVLQAYSLQNVLIDQGYDVEIINYIPDNFSVNTLKWIIANSGIKEKLSFNSLKRIYLNLSHQKKLLKGFEEFQKNCFRLSKKCNEENWVQQFSTYDVIIVGSDQVWNPYNQKQDVYFVNSELIHARRISYAADSTKADFVQERYSELRKALQGFHSISVRNIHTERFVRSLTERNPLIVPDPVVLSNFESLFNTSVDSKYILVYVLGKEIPGGHKPFLEGLRKKHPHYKIIQIGMVKQNKFAIIDGIDRVVYDCTPEQWLNYIRNAQMVYTDSFHCILFSLKFHVNFIGYYSENNRAPRLKALQTQYDLKGKIVAHSTEALKGIEESIDFSKVELVFEHEKNKALQFIRQSLLYEEGIN